MKIVCGVIFIFLIAVYFIYSINKNTTTIRNDVTIHIKDPNVAPQVLKIAVIGDIHLPEGSHHLEKFRDILIEIKNSRPDLVIFLGDYIQNHKKLENFSAHRKNIIKAIKLIEPLPIAVVLGNHETYSNVNTWISEFARFGIHAMENEVKSISVKNRKVCVRGLGDHNTNRFVYRDFPPDCKNRPKITITHDPAGAFNGPVQGLVFSGHTHCGQIRFPLLGAVYVPTDAPSEAHCGLYHTKRLTLFVTSGVGNSIVPVRYGAQSQWDFVSLNIN